MADMATTVTRKLIPIVTDPRWLLIFAHVLALLALALGLQFLLSTTGGTLFLFSAVGPLLVLGSVTGVVWVAILRFRQRYSLFAIRSYEPGEWILRQGDPGDCAYFIQSGQVEIRHHDGRSEKVLSILRPGEYFGEMALLSGEPRNASARALDTTTLAVLGKHNFLALLRTIPSTREDIMKTVQKRAMQTGR